MQQHIEAIIRKVWFNTNLNEISIEDVEELLHAAYHQGAEYFNEHQFIMSIKRLTQSDWSEVAFVLEQMSAKSNGRVVVSY